MVYTGIEELFERGIMRRIAIIGIGSGNPQHLTVEGVATLQQADVVIAIDKGEEKHDLLELRKEILATHSPDVPLVTVLDPPRDRKPVDYQAEVQRWHQKTPLRTAPRPYSSGGTHRCMIRRSESLNALRRP